MNQFGSTQWGDRAKTNSLHWSLNTIYTISVVGIFCMTLKYLIFINIATTHTRSYSLQSIPLVTIHLPIDPPILFPSNSSYLLHHSVMLALNQNGICNLPLWRKSHGISSCIMSVYSNNFTFAWIRLFPQQKISLLCKCVVFFNPHCA